MNSTNEQTLLAQLRQDDEAAFDTLFRAYYEPLCRYATSILNNLDDAEDVVQQVFIKFWEQRTTLDVKWSVKAYLYKMVHNRSLNRLRDALNREQKNAQHALTLEQSYDPQQDAGQELTERLQKALSALPTECRRIFELSRFEELKYREIADQLGISIKTVETQMGKALRVLRVELADLMVLFLGFALWKMADTAPFLLHIFFSFSRFCLPHG